MKFDVFGRKIEAIKKDGKWKVYLFGTEGKKRLAEQIIVPEHIQESDLISYFSDIYHEWASPSKNQVTEQK